MVKNELITKVQEKIDIEVSKKDLEIILNGLTSVIKDAVLAGDTVTIPDVCKISSKDVPERTGKVMLGDKVGETWVKPAHKEATVKIMPSFRKIFE